MVAADDAVGEDAEVLVAFAEVDEDAFAGGEGGGGEDGDVGGGLGRVKGEAEGLEVEVLETG